MDTRHCPCHTLWIQVSDGFSMKVFEDFMNPTLCPKRMATSSSLLPWTAMVSGVLLSTTKFSETKQPCGHLLDMNPPRIPVITRNLIC